MIVLGWILRLIAALLAGAILLSGLSALGLYEAAELVRALRRLITIDLMNIAFWPFDWFEFDWFEISFRERSTIALVWALMITPALRNILVSSEPMLAYAALEGSIALTVFSIPFSIFMGIIYALMMGLFCFLLPDVISVFALFGWMGYIQVQILFATFFILSKPVPDTEDEYYRYMEAKGLMLLSWKTYGEIAIGAVLIYWADRYVEYQGSAYLRRWLDGSFV